MRGRGAGEPRARPVPARAPRYRSQRRRRAVPARSPHPVPARAPGTVPSGAAEPGTRPWQRGARPSRSAAVPRNAQPGAAVPGRRYRSLPAAIPVPIPIPPDSEPDPDPDPSRQRCRHRTRKEPRAAARAERVYWEGARGTGPGQGTGSGLRAGREPRPSGLRSPGPGLTIPCQHKGRVKNVNLVPAPRHQDLCI